MQQRLVWSAVGRVRSVRPSARRPSRLAPAALPRVLSASRPAKPYSDQIWRQLRWRCRGSGSHVIACGTAAAAVLVRTNGTVRVRLEEERARLPRGRLDEVLLQRHLPKSFELMRDGW